MSGGLVDGPGLGSALANALAGTPEPAPGYDPRPMGEPRVLYRSISLPEFADIWRTGKVMGGGNLFNLFDPRPDVFFADEITDPLVRQGEYVDRQVTFALRGHQVSLRLERLHAQLDDQAELILREMDRDGISYDTECAEDFRMGFERCRLQRVAFRRGPAARRKYGKLFRVLRRLERDCDAADADYGREFAAAVAERVQWLSSLPFSSAILVTRPVSGGVVYSAEFGWSGLGEREYGFAPGHVTLADVAEIILIKFCQKVGRCRPGGLSARNGGFDHLIL